MAIRRKKLGEVIRSQGGFIMTPYWFGGAGGGVNDPSFDYVSFLSGGEVDELGQIPSDESNYGRATTRVEPGARISNVQAKFGTTSIYGTPTGTTLPSSADWAVGQVFTCELWYYPKEHAGAWFANNSSGAFQFAYKSATEWGVAANLVAWRLTTTSLPTLNAWNHMAVTRDNANLMKLFLNGTQVASGTVTDAFTTAASASIFQTYGYVDDFRLTKGVARYTASFTAPTAAFPDNVAGDANFNSVVLLCHGNGTHNEGLLIDSSNSARRFGTSAEMTSEQFKFGTRSLRLYNSDVRISASAEFDVTAGDFTAEAWIRPTTLTGSPYLFHFYINGSNRYAVGIDSATNRLSIYTTSSGLVTTATTGTLTTNVWQHVSFVKTGATSKLFLDGVEVYSGSITYPSGNPQLIIGSAQLAAASNYFDGYLDEIRITKSVARYTTAFTPPTSAFPRQPSIAVDPFISNVVSLLHMDGVTGDKSFVDSSYTAATYTAASTAAIDASTSKFGRSSGVFGGSGIYLDSPSSSTYTLGTGDFTIEFWWKNTGTTTSNRVPFDMRPTGTQGLYPTIYALNGSIFYFVNNANVITGSIDSNVWRHIALTRSGTSTRLFVDGVQVGSTYTDTNNYLGTRVRLGNGGDATTNGAAGYIDEFRMTKGVARYTSNFTPSVVPFQSAPLFGDAFIDNVSLLLHMDGTNGSTTFTDGSKFGNTITSVASASVDTSKPKFGSGALKVNGFSQYLSMPTAPHLEITNTDFTIESWIYIREFATNNAAAGYASVIIGKDINTTTGRELIFSLIGNAASFTTINFVAFNSGTNSTAVNIGASFGFVLNRWYHVAASRSGNVYSVFVDGTQLSTATTAVATNVSTTSLKIGAQIYDASNPQYFSGYIDDVRITKGVARYKASFIPPTAPFSDYEFVVTQLPLSGSSGSTTFTDQTSRHTYTGFGSPAISSGQTLFGNNTLSLNGSSQYISTPPSTDFDFYSGDWTLEANVRFTSIDSNLQTLMTNRPSTVGTNRGFAFLVASNGIVFRGFDSGNNLVITLDGGTLSAGTWYHLAVSCNSGVVTGWIDGVLVATANRTGALAASPNDFTIGLDRSVPGRYLAGNVANVRVTKGLGRYTKAFTPPTSAYTSYAAFVGPLDSYTSGLWAAYGTKRLLSTYTGPLLRLRRSTDNAELDIGYLNDGTLDSISLYNFIGPNSAFDVAWYDQYSNAAHMQQATTARQPRLSNAGAYDGTIRYNPTGGTDGFTRTTATGSSAVSAKTIFRKMNQRGIATNGTEFEYGDANQIGAAGGSNQIQILQNTSPNNNAIFLASNSGAAYRVAGYQGVNVSTQTTGIVIAKNAGSAQTTFAMWGPTGPLGQSFSQESGSPVTTGNFPAYTWSFGGRGTTATLGALIDMHVAAIYDANMSETAVNIAAAIDGVAAPATPAIQNINPTVALGLTSYSLSNNNRTGTSNSTTQQGHFPSYKFRVSGKRYFEVRYDTAGAQATASDRISVGIMAKVSSDPQSGTGGGNGNKMGSTNSIAIDYSGTVVANSSGINSPFGAVNLVVGDIIGVAWDSTTNVVWFSKNGTFSGNPAAGTGGYGFSAAASGYVAGFSISANQNAVMTAAYEAVDLAFAPPSGFVAWNA